MNLLLPLLALVLIGGNLFGRLAQRIALPSVFGELVLGLVLGPFIAQWSHGSDFSELGNIGVILLMLLVGMETDFESLAGIGVSSFFVAFCGAILPFLIGSGVAYFFFRLPPSVALVVGVALSATSVSITAATLREMGKMQLRVGKTILMAAVIDDVLGLILLTFVTGQVSGVTPVEAMGRVLAVIVITMVSGLVLTPIIRFWEKRIEGFLAVAIGVGFLYAWMASVIGGLAPITGAYVAGLILGRAAPHERVIRGVETMASGFFATIFFVSLGLNVRLTTIHLSWLGIFLGIAILTKLIGCGFGAKITGVGWGESLAIGIGMIPRGEVALIVASIGFNAHILSLSLFSLLVVLTVGTTVITPLLLKGVFVVLDRGERTQAFSPQLIPVADGMPRDFDFVGEEV